MNRIAILSNAGSGRNVRRRRWLGQLATVADVRQEVTRSPAEIDGALDRLLADDPALLAINGGDGTVQSVLTAMARRGIAPPAVTVLPAGSTNMTAHELRCGGRLDARMRDLLSLRDTARSAWPVVRRRPLRLDRAEGPPEIGFFLGLGTIVRGIEFWHGRMAHGAGAGEWGAGAALARAAWGILRREPRFAAPVRVRLAVDGGEPRETELLFALVTPMKRLFLGLTPFWGEGEGALAFTWVDRGPHRFARRIPDLLRGRGERLPEADGYHSLRADRVVLEPEESFVIDGEPFPAGGRIELTAAPALDVVALEGPRPGEDGSEPA